MAKQQESATDKIAAFFQGAGPAVYSVLEMRHIWDARRESFDLPLSLRFGKFMELAEKAGLREAKIDFPARKNTKYFWGDVSTLRLVQSIDLKGYFTHYSAMHFHQLTEQLPKTIYFNREQRNAGSGGDLTQTSIDRAFRGKCRLTNNIATYEGGDIVSLNGQNTGRLAVIEGTADGGTIFLTNMERTLIDATVRPVYSGGVFEVAKAYEKAREKISVNKLVAILKKLDYTYPYHQAIGYYLQRAGYSKAQLQMLHEFEIEFDFYLDYGMKQKDYEPTWRLFVPKGF